MLKILQNSSFQDQPGNTDLNVFVGLTPCMELTFKHWTFWRKNSLFLLPQTISLATELNLNLNSRIYYLDSNFSFFEIYKYQPNDYNFNIRKINDAITPDISKKTKSIWERRSNLSTIHLNINYINNPPYTKKENGSQKVTGFLGEIFYELQENLGFQYTLIDPESNVWVTSLSLVIISGLHLAFQQLYLFSLFI